MAGLVAFMSVQGECICHPHGPVDTSLECADDSSWNKELARDRGRWMAEEYRAKGVHVLLGPVVGAMGRVVEGGRNWEGVSPDPYLSGVLGAESVQGIQSTGVAACIKV